MNSLSLRSKSSWGIFLAAQLIAIGLARLALVQPLYAAAVIYAVGFTVLAWNKPPIALALIFATAPFQESLAPGGPVLFSLTEINLSLMLPVVLLRGALEKRRLQFGPLAAPLAVYFLVCMLSSLITWRGRDTFVSMLQMVLYLIVGLTIFSSYVRRAEDFLLSLRALLVVAVFFSLVMLIKHNNFILDLHKNGVGASLACAFLVGVELWLASRSSKEKKWLLAALFIIFAGLAYSLSRGAWFGAFFGLLWIIAMRGEWKLLLRGTLVFLPLVAVGWTMLPQSQREYATGFGREHWNINARYQSVEYARRNWQKNQLLGVGVGLREEFDATDVAWLTLAETGVIGLVAFAWLNFAFLRAIAVARRRVARDELLFSLLIIGGALILRQLAHGMVDHYWGRGPLAMAWASAGMAIYAYSIARSRSGEQRLF